MNPRHAVALALVGREGEARVGFTMRAYFPRVPSASSRDERTDHCYIALLAKKSHLGFQKTPLPSAGLK